MGVPDVKPNGAETRRRLNLVERAMHERGWSTSLARALAKQIGVDTRTVYRYRAQVLEDIKQAVTVEDHETQRAEFIDRVRRYQSSAREQGAWGAVSSMLNCEAKVLGIEAPQRHEVVTANVSGALTDDDLARFAHWQSRWDELEEKARFGTLTEMERHAMSVMEGW